MQQPEAHTLAFVGGTGPEGRGLAMRFASLGHRVIIGSRSEERASEAAEEIGSMIADSEVTGAVNEEAATAADIVILTIPYSGLEGTLPPLRATVQGKVVISAVAPVEFVEGRPVALRPSAGSAAEEVLAALPEARVVSAFQTIDAHRLQHLDEDLKTDVVVCSDDVEARRLVVRLAAGLPGVRALSGGRLAASRYVEELTALLITLNRIYKAHSGIHFTGIDR